MVSSFQLFHIWRQNNLPEVLKKSILLQSQHSPCFWKLLINIHQTCFENRNLQFSGIHMECCWWILHALNLAIPVENWNHQETNFLRTSNWWQRRVCLYHLTYAESLLIAFPLSCSSEVIEILKFRKAQGRWQRKEKTRLLTLRRSRECSFANEFPLSMLLENDDLFPFKEGKSGAFWHLGWWSPEAEQTKTIAGPCYPSEVQEIHAHLRVVSNSKGNKMSLCKWIYLETTCPCHSDLSSNSHPFL